MKKFGKEASRRLSIPLLAILSATLFALAQPNEIFLYGNPLLGLPALAPFFIALSRCRSYRGAGLTGALFLALYTIGTSYWLLAFDDFALWTLGGTVFGYAGYGFVLGQYLRYFLIKPQSALPGYWRPLFVALSWMVYEFLKSSGFLGYPWGLSIYPFNEQLLFFQIADITGIWFPVFLVALINALLAEAFLPRPAMDSPQSSRNQGHQGGTPSSLQGSLFLFFLLTLTALYGAVRLTTPWETLGHSRLLLVQKDDNPWLHQSFAGALEHTINVTEEGRQEMAAAGRQPDLIAWSETALWYPYSQNTDYYQTNPGGYSFTDYLAAGEDTLYLVGAPVLVNTSPYEAMNGAILLNAQGEVLQKYGKQHPVPFAESIPFWEFEITRNLFKNVLGITSGWVLGQENSLFPLPGRTPEGKERTFDFAIPICFEDAFPALCRSMIRDGADLWINLTNDSWSQTVSAETQHLVAARFRSIENRRTMVRATNGGITAVIHPAGHITHDLPPFQSLTLEAEIPIDVLPGDRITFYTRWGDWIIYGALLILLGELLFSLLVKRKSGTKKKPVPEDRPFHENGNP